MIGAPITGDVVADLDRRLLGFDLVGVLRFLTLAPVIGGAPDAGCALARDGADVSLPLKVALLAAPEMACEFFCLGRWRDITQKRWEKRVVSGLHHLAERECSY